MTAGAAGIEAVDHVAVAGWSIAEMLPLYQDLLGGCFLRGADNHLHGVRTIQLTYPKGFKIELMEPLGEDSYLAGHLRKRGPGLHHVTLYVQDFDRARDAVRASGMSVVGLAEGDERWKECYLSPRETGGALVQLGWAGADWALEGAGLRDVLAGRVIWDGGGYTLRPEQ